MLKFAPALLILVLLLSAGPSRKGIEAVDRVNPQEAIKFLAEQPVYYFPSSSRGHYLCLILESAVRLWWIQQTFPVPTTIKDLHARGILLWNLRDMKPAGYGSGRGSDGSYKLIPLEGQDGNRGQGLAEVCYASRGRDGKYWEGTARYFLPKAKAEGEAGKNLPLDHGGLSYETPEFLYLKQLRWGLALHYAVKRVPARSREALKQLIGEESTAWTQPGLARLLEKVIADHKVEAMRKNSTRKGSLP
ncbi:MAG: hypothetical protein V2G42_06940 [bacterium JZ-2024 1]